MDNSEHGRSTLTLERDNFGQILAVDLDALRNFFSVADERIHSPKPLIPPNCFVSMFTNNDTLLHRVVAGRPSYYALLQRQNIEIDSTPSRRGDAHLVGMTYEIGQYNEQLPPSVPITILAPAGAMMEIVDRLSQERDVSHIVVSGDPTDTAWAERLKARLWRMSTCQRYGLCFHSLLNA